MDTTPAKAPFKKQINSIKAYTTLYAMVWITYLVNRPAHHRIWAYAGPH
jgi:hypothetical protein